MKHLGLMILGMAAIGIQLHAAPAQTQPYEEKKIIGEKSVFPPPGSATLPEMADIDEDDTSADSAEEAPNVQPKVDQPKTGKEFFPQEKQAPVPSGY